ncbi:MAG: hypothetical protein RMY34_34520 [Aulosira sp. DedQUE10]|nr:hypothetical protein [Aulosira sp. DedQUE10]
MTTKRGYPDNTGFEQLSPDQLWGFHFDLNKKTARQQMSEESELRSNLKLCNSSLWI